MQHTPVSCAPARPPTELLLRARPRWHVRSDRQRTDDSEVSACRVGTVEDDSSSDMPQAVSPPAVEGRAGRRESSRVCKEQPLIDSSCSVSPAQDSGKGIAFEFTLQWW